MKIRGATRWPAACSWHTHPSTRPYPAGLADPVRLATNASAPAMAISASVEPAGCRQSIRASAGTGCRPGRRSGCADPPGAAANPAPRRSTAAAADHAGLGVRRPIKASMPADRREPTAGSARPPSAGCSTTLGSQPVAGDGGPPAVSLACCATPTYIGQLPFNGQQHQASHDPIIDWELFQRAQLLLAERSDSPRTQAANASDYLLTNFYAASAAATALSGRPRTATAAPTATTPASPGSATAPRVATSSAFPTAPWRRRSSPRS
jgi:hypothetical protein